MSYLRTHSGAPLPATSAKYQPPHMRKAQPALPSAPAPSPVTSISAQETANITTPSFSPLTFAPRANNQAPAKGKGKKKKAKATPPPVSVPASFITTLPAKPKPTTLFPKISGGLKEIESRYRMDNKDQRQFKASKGTARVLKKGAKTVINFVGTVKLDGTHADIVISGDNKIRLQSKTRGALDQTAQGDNYGFAKAMFQQETAILAMKDKIVQQWLELKKGLSLSSVSEVVIAGEWIGPGIMAGSLLETLDSNLFVVHAIAVNGVWVEDKLYEHIEEPEAGILNVARGGCFQEKLDVTDVEPCLKAMMAKTMEVVKQCPFAATFGIVGRGEGIVWKAAHPLGQDPRFWVKTKPAESSATNQDALPNPHTTEDQAERTWEFTLATVTQARLEQGWNFLPREMQTPNTNKATGAFTSWVKDDIFAEEASRMEECKVDKEYLLKCICWVAGDWYGKRLEDEKSGRVGSMTAQN
ncbi:hypothetical protein LZ554_007610 [Drepanopeziza brunnea f. sp. 'monogermtubi']|nr:hypothetical protein LZ554_007610 [Drepanopeziza brunnea f. sp. 'monogermtubi']